MACDTCGHTIQNIGAEGQRIFWCPRCGSLTTEFGERRSHERTMLAGYVRAAEEAGVGPSQTGGIHIGRQRWIAILEAAGKYTARWGGSQCP